MEPDSYRMTYEKNGKIRILNLRYMNIKNYIKNEWLNILQVACRYYLAYQMFAYAFAKIFKTQFDLGPVYLADEAIDHFNGFMLTWNYFGYSRTYGLIIAALQILIGLLLLFRKTMRAGVILFLSMISNIVLINYFYEIDGAMLFSVILMILGLFLLFSEWRSYAKLFFKTDSKEASVSTLLPEKFKKLYWSKLLLIPLMLFFAFSYIKDIKTKYLKDHELNGIWKATSTSSDRYFKLFMGSHQQLKIKDFFDNFYYGQYVLNETEKTLKINAKCYTETGAFIVQDSIDKLDVSEENLKSIRTDIIAHYNKERNSLPYDTLFNYELKKDTLILKNDSLQLQLVNITKNYRH